MDGVLVHQRGDHAVGGAGTGRAEGAVILCRAGGLQSSIEERGCDEGDRPTGERCAVCEEGAHPAPRSVSSPTNQKHGRFHTLTAGSAGQGG